MSELTFNPHYDPTLWNGFGVFTTRVALGPEDRSLVHQWLEAEHFLGTFKPVGHSFCHIIYEDNRPVAVAQWAACAYHLKDREAFIGWSSLQCARRRNLVVNNVRFLVLDASRRPNLASKALAHSVKALCADWQQHFGYQPLLAETFTDIELHEGTCYKAAGWTPLGLTEGNSRQRAEFYLPNQRPKKLWIKELRTDARARLCAPNLAPEHAAGETSGKGAPLPIKASELLPLISVLRGVKDPRAKNRHYHIGLMLTMIAFGLLCGGTNLSEIVRHLNRLTQVQLRMLGIFKRKGKNKLEPPTHECFRQLLLALDLDAFAQTLSEWLSAHRGALPSALALDGKRIRGTLGTIVTLCDTEAKVPIAVAVTIEPGGEQACARELLRREQTVILNSTVSMDALFTNNENASIIVQEKGADYFISLKDNQPGVRAHVVEKFLSPTITGHTGSAGTPTTNTCAPLLGANAASQAGLMEKKTIQEEKTPTGPSSKAKKAKPPGSEANPETRTILVPAPRAGNEHLFKKRPRAAMAK
jgi:hypothetical protein